ncbi:hypothetical protein B0H17DRAFT_1154188 [Mycena rosella]|uniref:Uncharacterized protein n=1 Tax=Mycena rosella TaxID=1033263 RepID=A0AAD7F944_MYCRO|nr:hypothetical protein B0H17DRAFT_1154188 [Mycena rosella]
MDRGGHGNEVGGRRAGGGSGATALDCFLCCWGLDTGSGRGGGINSEGARTFSSNPVRSDGGGCSTDSEGWRRCGAGPDHLEEVETRGGRGSAMEDDAHSGVCGVSAADWRPICLHMQLLSAPLFALLFTPAAKSRKGMGRLLSCHRGMTSLLNHHHENGLPVCVAPGEPCIPGTTLAPTCRTHMGHHRHLETLLDSALATLTLIRGNTAHVQHFTPHLLEVLRLLNHHILASPSTTLSTTPPAATTIAPSPPATTSPHPATDAVDKALRSHFKDTFPKFLAGVQWSQNRNLILHPHLDFCTAKFIAEQDEEIWTVLRPLLGLADNHPCPLFDTDEKWHSVVFHGVPMLADRRPEAYTWSAVSTCTVSEEMHGELMGHSVLCGLEDFRTRRSVAIPTFFNVGAAFVMAMTVVWRREVPRCRAVRVVIPKEGTHAVGKGRAGIGGWEKLSSSISSSSSTSEVLWLWCKENGRRGRQAGKVRAGNTVEVNCLGAPSVTYAGMWLSCPDPPLNIKGFVDTFDVELEVIGWNLRLLEVFLNGVKLMSGSGHFSTGDM